MAKRLDAVVVGAGAIGLACAWRAAQKGLAVRVFELEWQPDWRLVVTGAALGMVGAMTAGLFATRRVLDASPMSTLRDLNA